MRRQKKSEPEYDTESEEQSETESGEETGDESEVITLGGGESDEEDVVDLMAEIDKEFKQKTTKRVPRKVLDAQIMDPLEFYTKYGHYPDVKFGEKDSDKSEDESDESEEATEEDYSVSSDVEESNLPEMSSSPQASNQVETLTNLRTNIYEKPDTIPVPTKTTTTTSAPAKTAPKQVSGTSNELFQQQGYNYTKLQQSTGRKGYTKKELEQIAKTIGVKYLTKDKKEDITQKILASLG